MNAKSIKKISKSGEGLVVFITQECKKLHWTNSDYVSVQIEGEGREAKLIMKRIEV
ncbi:hypothetical protein HZC07_01290 [Candidatus Micrarchaeota archaeon]|nr:hypothetical protein [Candidatus Micrarchaeota archaeon]